MLHVQIKHWRDKRVFILITFYKQPWRRDIKLTYNAAGHFSLMLHHDLN